MGHRRRGARAGHVGGRNPTDRDEQHGDGGDRRRLREHIAPGRTIPFTKNTAGPSAQSATSAIRAARESAISSSGRIREASSSPRSRARAPTPPRGRPVEPRLEGFGELLSHISRKNVGLLSAILGQVVELEAGRIRVDVPNQSMRRRADGIFPPREDPPLRLPFLDLGLVLRLGENRLAGPLRPAVDPRQEGLSLETGERRVRHESQLIEDRRQ